MDDHAVLRDGLRAMLETSDDFSVIGEAADGLEAIGMLESIDPDVVLMDVRMPNQDGLATLRQMREQNPVLPVLILSMYDDPAYVEEAIASGASGYLLKTITKEELSRAVRAAQAGQGYLQAEITRPVLGRFTRAHARDSEVALSPRETEVLQHIANGLANKNGKRNTCNHG